MYSIETSHLYLLTFLLVGHLLVDFNQGFISIKKRRISKQGEIKRLNQWIPFLLLHGFMHGLVVGIVLSSFSFFILEAVAHSIIDFFKCEKFYGNVIDQMLHISCKLVWLGFFISFNQSSWI